MCYFFLPLIKLLSTSFNVSVNESPQKYINLKKGSMQE